MKSHLCLQYDSNIMIPDEPTRMVISKNGTRKYVLSRHFDKPVDMKRCVECGKVRSKKYCKKCKKVRYCSRKCQKIHWVLNHKFNCQNLNANGH